MSDISHAHAVFLEITFGVNTVFAIYKELREYITTWFGKMVDQYVATIKGIEVSGEDNRETVNYVAGLLQGIADSHLKFQSGLFAPVGWFAVVFALSAAAILYFDYVDWVGYWCGILFLPLPVYAIMLVLNYASFRSRGRKLVKEYRIYNRLSTRFKPTQILPPPPV